MKKSTILLSVTVSNLMGLLIAKTEIQQCTFIITCSITVIGYYIVKQLEENKNQ